MGLLARLRTGWSLAVDSARVLQGQPELLAFPVIGGVAGLAWLAVVLLGRTLLPLPAGNLGVYTTLFVLYLGETFLGSLVSAALIHETRVTFEGGEPAVRSGLQAAWRHKRTLLAWSVVAATVGVLLRVLESKAENRPGVDVAASAFGAAWAVLTYFVVPVVVFEEIGVGAALRRSAETFRATWGESAGTGFGVGLLTVGFVLVGFVVAFVGIVIAAALGSVAGAWGALALGAALVVVAYLAGVALGGVARTALYVYATEGTTPGAFGDVELSYPR